MSEPINEQKPQSLTLTQRQPRELREVQSSIPIFDTGDFEHMQRVAKALSMASVIPDHLRAKPYFMGKNGLAPAELKQVRAELGEAEWARAWAEADARTTANCFLVVNQARNWNMDPVAVAMASYVVGGKIAYEGKLVAALVNTRAKLVQKLWYTFAGEKQDLTITVHGTREGESDDRAVTVRVGDAATDKDIWKKDPEQKLVYTGSIKWARRWVPEVVLGVTTDDDLEVIEREKNITPPAAGGVRSLEERLAERLPPTPTIAMTAAEKEFVEARPVGKPAPAEPAPAAKSAGTKQKKADRITLAAEDVDQLRGKAAANKVGWTAVEEFFGGPIEDVSEAGKDEKALWGMVEDAIRTVATRQRAAAEKGGGDGASSSLFDDKK